jgi:glycosyltransferase involved in cell wall biosynthesis
MQEQPERTPGVPELSVVVPVFNERAVLPELWRRSTEALGGLRQGYEVVFVDDGSSDGSTEYLTELARQESAVSVIVLSRNFGLEVAMSAGLDYAAGDHVVLMHADLQDPPELIPEMLTALREADADVVYTRRIGSDESRLKRFLATVFYRMMERISRVPYQGQAGDFKLMTRRVVDVLDQMGERRRFLRGMVAWAGFRQVPIDYHRGRRTSGRGASYGALLRLAFEALAAFSDVPLHIATYTGFLAAGAGLTAGVVAVLLLVLGVVELTASLGLLIAIIFLGGVQLITIGILGRYLARVHEEALARPLYVVDRVVGRPSTPSGAD